VNYGVMQWQPSCADGRAAGVEPLEQVSGLSTFVGPLVKLISFLVGHTFGSSYFSLCAQRVVKGMMSWQHSCAVELLDTAAAAAAAATAGTPSLRSSPLAVSLASALSPTAPLGEASSQEPLASLKTCLLTIGG
jgi:hypothetical protein